jgi:hypothetical protein
MDSRGSHKTKKCYSPRASIATAGIKITSMKLLDPVKRVLVQAAGCVDNGRDQAEGGAGKQVLMLIRLAYHGRD